MIRIHLERCEFERARAVIDRLRDARDNELSPVEDLSRGEKLELFVDRVFLPRIAGLLSASGHERIADVLGLSQRELQCMPGLGAETAKQILATIRDLLD